MIWNNMRVEKSTMEELERYKDSIVTQIERTPSKFPAYLDVVPLPLYLVIRYLVEGRRKHAARAKKSKLNRAWNQTVSLVDSPSSTTLDAE